MMFTAVLLRLASLGSVIIMGANPSVRSVFHSSAARGVPGSLPITFQVSSPESSSKAVTFPVYSVILAAYVGIVILSFYGVNAVSLFLLYTPVIRLCYIDNTPIGFVLSSSFVVLNYRCKVETLSPMGVTLFAMIQSSGG